MIYDNVAFTGRILWMGLILLPPTVLKKCLFMYVSKEFRLQTLNKYTWYAVERSYLLNNFVMPVLLLRRVVGVFKFTQDSRCVKK